MNSSNGKSNTSLLLLSAWLFVMTAASVGQADLVRGIRAKMPADQYGARTALVIGNAAYAHSALKNPVHDAQDVAKALHTMGFETEVLTNADRRTMGKAITVFGNRLKERKGVGLFFFAGHGMQVNGRNYLIPINATIDAEDEIEYESIAADLVLAKMNTAKNPLNMVFLDACRNNPFERSFTRSVAARGLAQMDAPKGSLIVYATAPGSVAADGRGRNGVFTKHLLPQMMKPSLDVVFMLREVREGVLQDTNNKQTPWASTSLRCTFCFNTQPAPNTDAPPVIVERAPKAKPFLGVRAQTLTASQAMALGIGGHSGALIADVMPSGPGAVGGLRPGDVVIRFGKRVVTTDTDIRESVHECDAGQSVPVEILRDKKRHQLTVILGSKE